LKFRGYVLGHPQFSADEQAALKIESVAAFHQAWSDTVKWKIATEERRKHGSRRVGKFAQDFVVAASDIMSYMGPILNLIRDIGAPFGGMAIGTVSFLFTVQKAIVKVRKTGEETLNKNVAVIKELYDAAARDRLSVLRRLLGLQVYEAKEKNYELLLEYEADHKYFTGNEKKRVETMNEAALEDLEKDQRWIDWRTSPKSSLLFMAGFNHNVGFEQCWLSPAAIHLVKTLYDEPPGNPDIYAFYILGIRPGQRNGEHITQVLSHIMIQLLMQNIRALQDGNRWEDLQGAFEEHATVVDAAMKDPKNVFKTRKNMEVAQSATLKVLNLFSHDGPQEQRTLWIVLDRVDRVKEPPVRLLEVLEYLIVKAKVKVKILVVVNGWDWKHLPSYIASLAEKREEGVIVYEGRQKRR
ncbi:hypothetical protein B0T20DRAFT_351096, partial [Sordaria brevicollis]